MKKAYSFRIYPNKKHEAKLNRTLTTCRHLYNDALAERRKHAELNRLKREFGVFPWGGFEWISYENQANNLARSKTQEQKEVYSQVLQNTLKRLDRSFVNFYNGFELDIEEEEIKLSKIGIMRVVLHREIEGKIKTCTVKKDVDQWYVIFTVEIDREIEPVELKTKIGVDVGLASLLTLSNGDQIKPPEYFRKSEKKLAKEQVRLSRKKKGSKNRQKQRIE